MSSKIVEIHTEHVMAFKTLFEVLKEILTEVVIEVTRDDEMNKKYTSEIKKKEAESDSDESDDDSKKKKKGKGKKEKKDKKKKDSDDDEDDDSSKKKKPCVGGLKILTVDSSKTVLINLKLDSNRFADFWCKPPKYEIGINLVQLYKHLKSLGDSDTLTMFIEDDAKQNLILKIDNPEKQSKSNCKIKLMDLDNDPMSIPETNFEAVIKMSSSEFHKICRDMNQFSEFVEIKCLTNSVTFSYKGDCSESTKTYDSGDKGVSIIHTNANKPHIVQGIYSLKNLVLFTKCNSLCSEIQIFMKMNYPLCIRYTVATLGRLIICLTPVDKDNVNEDDKEDKIYDSDSDDDDKSIKLKGDHKD